MMDTMIHARGNTGVREGHTEVREGCTVPARLWWQKTSMWRHQTGLTLTRSTSTMKNVHATFQRVGLGYLIYARNVTFYKNGLKC